MKYKITQITQRPRNNHAKRAKRATIGQKAGIAGKVQNVLFCHTQHK
jgi:hypothetical protein